MIPNPTYYPEQIDTDDNLFLVRDSLRIRLLEDYNPGDTIIYVEENEEIMSKFPPTGIITLTEQCSDIDKRAISFYYGFKSSNSFEKLEKLPEFEDFIKPKKITNVTMNVLDKHHNHLKDSLIEIQKFLGIKDQTDIVPFGDTITGRINFIKNVAYKPRPWFTLDKDIGLVPLEVNFKDASLRASSAETEYKWETKKNSDVSWSLITPVANEIKETKYTYVTPGIYDVRLTIKNKYGEEIAEFKNAIFAKYEAPEKAIINIVPNNSQKLIDVPGESWKKIRSSTNVFINLEIPEGNNPNNNNYTNAGEHIENSVKIDKIKFYKWELSDDLIHSNSDETKASYSLGGLYDIILRVDTEFGSYRITKYENAIDIIENQNLWLFNLNDINSNSSGILKTWEFGLINETFKQLGNQTVLLDRDNSFLNRYNSNVYDSKTKDRSKKEFFKNVEFAQQGSLSSGERGNSLLFWASGGPMVGYNQQIKIFKYNAFEDSYLSIQPINRMWNWVSLVSQDKVYFLLGENNTQLDNTNYSNPTRIDYDLISESFSNEISLSLSSFENGADELLNHPSYFDQGGLPTNGYFAVYRSAWKDSTGYILRNASVNEFFRISQFYKTNGNLSTPFNTISKLPDMSGSTKTEGELVSLSSGVFFFNNSGEISAWNDVSLNWEIGRANSSSLSFRSLQDSNVSDFENRSNPLLAASDGDSIAYLSYDYSKNAFIKFNSIDLTFSVGSQNGRPNGDQLKLGIY